MSMRTVSGTHSLGTPVLDDRECLSCFTWLNTHFTVWKCTYMCDEWDNNSKLFAPLIIKIWDSWSSIVASTALGSLVVTIWKSHSPLECEGTENTSSYWLAFSLLNEGMNRCWHFVSSFQICQLNNHEAFKDLSFHLRDQLAWSS